MTTRRRRMRMMTKRMRTCRTSPVGATWRVDSGTRPERAPRASWSWWRAPRGCTRPDSGTSRRRARARAAETWWTWCDCVDACCSFWTSHRRRHRHRHQLSRTTTSTSGDDDDHGDCGGDDGDAACHSHGGDDGLILTTNAFWRGRRLRRLAIASKSTCSRRCSRRVSSLLRPHFHRRRRRHRDRCRRIVRGCPQCHHHRRRPRRRRRCCHFRHRPPHHRHTLDVATRWVCCCSCRCRPRSPRSRSWHWRTDWPGMKRTSTLTVSRVPSRRCCSCHSSPGTTRHCAEAVAAAAVVAVVAVVVVDGGDEWSALGETTSTAGTTTDDGDSGPGACERDDEAPGQRTMPLRLLPLQRPPPQLQLTMWPATSGRPRRPPAMSTSCSRATSATCCSGTGWPRSAACCSRTRPWPSPCSTSESCSPVPIAFCSASLWNFAESDDFLCDVFYCVFERERKKIEQILKQLAWGCIMCGCCFQRPQTITSLTQLCSQLMSKKRMIEHPEGRNNNKNTKAAAAQNKTQIVFFNNKNNNTTRKKKESCRLKINWV